MKSVHIGISGFVYSGWRGKFYPAELPMRRWLEFASRTFSTIELNGTFYSLKTPASYERWVADTPDDFIFAIKGSRYITHNLKLRNADAALANFFASGVLGLGLKTGPFLWQLPASYGFDAERVATFLESLPRTAKQAEATARRHDARVKDPLTQAVEDIRFRHAMEVRHPSYFCDEFYDLLRRHDCAFVVADSAGKFPYAEEVTGDFVYVRLHGSTQLYVSGYTDNELDEWAAKIRRWRRTREVFVYFDNDAKVHAPFDAQRLNERVAAQGSGTARKAESSKFGRIRRKRHAAPVTRGPRTLK